MLFEVTYLHRFRRKPAILVSIVFHLLTTILRRFLQQSPVQAFITLIVVRSLSFGSNIWYFIILYNWFIYAKMLASNINLLTHYAKGTLLFIVYTLLELLIKLLFKSFPSRYFFYCLRIIYSLRGRSPFYSNRYMSILL